MVSSHQNPVVAKWGRGEWSKKVLSDALIWMLGWWDELELTVEERKVSVVMVSSQGLCLFSL